MSEEHSSESNRQPERSFEEKQRKYFYGFARNYFKQYPQDHGLWEEFGLSKRHKANEAVNYDGVPRHSVTEAALADVLAEKLGVSEANRDLLKRACMLHDLYRRERGEMQEPYKAGRSAEEELFDPNAHQGREVLRKKGVRPEVLELVEAMHSSGMTKIDFDETKDESALVKKIFWYIDSSLDNIKLVSVKQRVLKFKERESNIDRLGMNVLKDSKGKTLGMPLFDYYAVAGEKFEKGIASKLGLSAQQQQDFPKTITKWLAEKIEAIK